MNQLVQRYAQLSVIADKCRAQNLAIPRGVQTEMQHIYSTAQATLTPLEQQQAVRAVESFRAQAYGNLKAQAAYQQESQAMHYRDKIAKGLSGMTVDQVQAAKQGKKYVQRGSKFNPNVTKQKIVGMVQRATGKKLSFDKIYEHSCALESEPDKLGYLKLHFGNKAQQMEGFFKGFEDSGAGIQIKLTEKRYSEDEYVEPSDDEVLRAQVTDAVAVNMNEGVADWAVRDIDQAYMADEGSLGDVARAMAKVGFDDE